MAIGDYTDTTTVLAELPGVADTNGALAKAITAASRQIDRMTGTRFYPVTEARLFDVTDRGRVWVDRFTSTTGLTISYGTDGVTYGTTLTANQYTLWPHNAPSRGAAYRRIDVPYSFLPWGYGFPTVQVTAAWGYDTVPPEVEQATRILAKQLFRRQYATEGKYSATGENDYGQSRDSDPDVMRLLADFIDPAIA